MQNRVGDDPISQTEICILIVCHGSLPNTKQELHAFSRQRCLNECPYAWRELGHGTQISLFGRLRDGSWFVVELFANYIHI